MVVLFFASSQVSERKFFHRLFVFFAFAVGMYSVGTSWVHNSFREVGDVSSTVTIWVTVLFVVAASAVFAGIFIAIQEIWARRPRFKETTKNNFSLTWNTPSAKNSYSVFGTVLAWVVFELQNTLVQSEIAFPWLLAGYAFIDTWLVGLATVGGVTLVSFFALVTAIALYRVQHIKPTTMVLAILPWVVGFGLLNVQWTKPLEEKEIALVQSNLTITEKVTSPTYSWSLHSRLSFDEEGVDFVIWPEGALHITLSQDYVNALHYLAARLDASIITGILSETSYRGGETIPHNAAVGVGKYRPEYEEYIKQKLVPFGEYIPFEPVVRPLMKWLDLPTSDLRPGRGQPENMNLDEVNVGVMICYEIAFPGYVAQRSRDADFLVTISEDGWFGNSIGPAQHMQIARMRAIETARYVARATTTGISGIVDPKGKLVATIPANELGIVRGTIQTLEGETWFVRYLSGLSGWLWGAFFVVGSAVLSSLGIVFITSYGKRVFLKERNKYNEADSTKDVETEEGVEAEEELEEEESYE